MRVGPCGCVCMIGVGWAAPGHEVEGVDLDDAGGRPHLEPGQRADEDVAGQGHRAVGRGGPPSQSVETRDGLDGRRPPPF